MTGTIFFLHLYFSALTAQLGDSLYMAEHAGAFNTTCSAPAPETAGAATDAANDDCRRWTYFINTALGYGQQGNSDSTLAGGMMGFTGRMTDDLTLGIAATGARATDAIDARSESDTATTGGSLFMAYAPKNGFRLYASGMMQKMSIDTTRAYGASRSDGNTDATAYGAAARVGWAFAASQRDTLMPYIESRWASASADSFSETGGTAPADYNESTLSNTQLRFGISDAHKVHNDLILTGTLAFGARLDSGRNQFTGTASGSPVDQGSDAGHRTWTEASIAADWRVSDGIVVQGRLIGHTAKTIDPALAGNLGVSLGF